MGDPLNKLPSTRVSHDDPTHLQLLTNIFGGDSEKARDVSNICVKNMDIILASILFFVISLPLTANIIIKIYSKADNQWTMAIIKTVIFAIALFLLYNSKFAKK